MADPIESLARTIADAAMETCIQAMAAEPEIAQRLRAEAEVLHRSAGRLRAARREALRAEFGEEPETAP